MGRFYIFPIFIATFASRRVTLIATHSKSQKQTRLPIHYLYFILPFKPLINKEVIKVFQNYRIILTKQPCGASESALPMLLQAASAVLPAQSEPSDSLLGALSE